MKTKCASVVIEKNGKILMLDRSSNFPPLGLDLIGGHLDPGESPEVAAIREAREEANIEICVEEKICSFDWSDEKGEHLEHVFTAKILNGVPSDSEEGKVVWVPVDEIMKRNLAFPPFIEKFLEFYEKFRKAR